MYLSSESDLAHAKAQEKKKTGDTFVIHNKLRHIIGSLRRIPRTTTLWLSLSRFPFSFPTVSVVFPSIHYYVLERRLYFFFSPPHPPFRNVAHFSSTLGILSCSMRMAKYMFVNFDGPQTAKTHALELHLTNQKAPCSESKPTDDSLCARNRKA